jgi:hypothetical protein
MTNDDVEVIDCVVGLLCVMTNGEVGGNWRTLENLERTYKTTRPHNAEDKYEYQCLTAVRT